MKINMLKLLRGPATLDILLRVSPNLNDGSSVISKVKEITGIKVDDCSIQIVLDEQKKQIEVFVLEQEGAELFLESYSIKFENEAHGKFLKLIKNDIGLANHQFIYDLDGIKIA